MDIESEKFFISWHLFVVRKVRCGAAECLSHLVAVQRSSFQKQVFVQVDAFFHDHEMSLGREGDPLEGQPAGAAPFRTNTSTRIQQGLTDLMKTVVAMLEKEGRNDLAPLLSGQINLINNPYWST